MTAKNIGEFIQKLRKEKGLTQREPAGQIGISDKTISKCYFVMYLYISPYVTSDTLPIFSASSIQPCVNPFFANKYR